MTITQSKVVYTGELMIVYDKKEDKILLNEMFMSEGYLVRFSNNGKRALVSIAVKQPDIILLDIKRPSLDGFEICKRLKSDEKTKNIPIIFISALDETKDRIKAFNLGATDFITKPFNKQEVIVRVGTHLNFRIHQMQIEKDNMDFQMEKEKRAVELLIANNELAFQNEEKEKRAAELLIANKELLFQSEEKEKRAAELTFANKEIAQKTKELLLAREQIELAGVIISRTWRYNRSLIEASIDPIITIDEDGLIIDVNTAVENATGLPKNKLIGTNFSEIFSNPEKAISYYQTVFEKGQSFNYELNLKHINGFTTPVIYNAFVSSDNEEKKVGVMVANNDVATKQKDEIVYLQVNLNLLIKQRTSELVIANEKLAIENEKNEYLGYHDYLTGLYNRRYFENEMKRLDTKTNLPLSIIMCDVDGLKLINDSFGHVFGDELLIKASEIIKKACRASDIVSRLGGDEFAVILPKTDVEETAKIANRIKEFAFQEKVKKINLSISYGYDTKIMPEQSLLEVFSTAENHMYMHKLYERSSMRSNTIDLIMNTLFEKSNRESMHSNRVSTICEAIASKMNFDKVNVKKIMIAGLVHDIGKIGIDGNILDKAGSLSLDEWCEVKKHPEIGWRILSSANEYLDLAQFVLNHHERWDGSGYPNGVKGEKIPLESRIIAVADAYDAMTSERSYRKAWSKEEAIKELKRSSGTQFDPQIIDVFFNQVLPYNNNFINVDKSLISTLLNDENFSDNLS